MQPQRLRRLWLAAHLYLGLSAGLLFVLAGLTGSLLVFYVEIDRMLNPALVITPSVNQPRQSYAAVVQALRQEHPERSHAWRLEVPLAPDRPIMARYYKPVETSHLSFAPLIVAVNPYTLEIINSRFWGNYAMTWIYDLHYKLLLDKSGKIGMAVLGMICLLLLAIGVYLWWPKTGNWKKAFALHLRRGAVRKVYDIHVISGVYGLVLLLILSVTGVLLEQPDWFAPTIERLAPTFKTAPVTSTVIPGDPPITADQAVIIAQRNMPDASPRWIEIPDGENGVYSVRMHQPDEPGKRFPKTQFWIDQYSGRVLAARNPQANSGGDTFLDWQHPLHSGEVFGLTGRLLVFIAGLLPAVLFISGWLRWRHKFHARPD